MADPTKFTPGFDYSDFEESNPTLPKPGAQLDNDFANAATSINGTVDALKDIRRSDGALKNQIVTLDSLSPTVKALLGDTSFVDTVGENIEDVVIVADSITDVNAVADISANVTTVAGVAADVTTVAGVAADVTTVASNIADVALVADNIDDVDYFTNLWLGPKAANPTTRNDGSPLEEGDAYFNTVSKELRVYDGANWQLVTGQVIKPTPDSFVGDGAETEFTLSVAAEDDADVLVWLDGVRRRPTVDYTVSGAVLTMLTAPADEAKLDTLVISVISPTTVIDAAAAAAASATAAAASAQAAEEAAQDATEIVTGLVLADEEEAKAGTSGSKIMSPLRTREALDQDIMYVSAQRFGVVADGAADGSGSDNSAALQDAIDYCLSIGAARLVLPPGMLVCRGPLTIVNADSAFQLVGSAMRNTVLVIDYEDVGGAFIDGTRYDDVTIAGRPKHFLLEDLQFVHSTAVREGMGPTPFRRLRCSDLRIDRVAMSLRGAAALELSSVFNGVINDLTIFGGGYHVGYKAAAGITFTIAEGGTTLTASADHFAAEDVGETIRLEGNPLSVFVIASVTSPTSAEVTEVATREHTDAVGAWGTISGLTTAGSNILTLKAARLTADDIGRAVYLTEAKAGDDGINTMGDIDGTIPLRAVITGVSGTTVTLDREATASTSRAELYFPAVDIIPDLGGSGGINNNSNDLTIDKLNIERFRGVGLVFDEALNIHGERVKVHANNNFGSGPDSDTLQSDMNIMFIKTSGFFRGDIEGVAINQKGQIHVYGQIGTLGLDGITGACGENQPLLFWDNVEPYGRVTVKDVTRNNYVTERTLGRLVRTTQLTPGPVIEGVYTAYRNNAQGAQRSPLPKSHGDFVSSLQSFLKAVVGTVRSGWEAIVYGEIPVFRGIRSGGTPTVPVAVSSGDVIARFEGQAMAPSGALASAGIIDIVAASPSGSVVQGRLTIRLNNSGGVMTDMITFAPTSISPIPTATVDLGTTANKFKTISVNDARLYPSSLITPFNNGEVNFEFTSNTELKIKAKGSDGVVRVGSITLS